MLQLVVFLVSTPGFLFVHSDLLEYITADDMHADVMYKENFKRKTEVVLTLKDKFAKKSIEKKIEILTNILNTMKKSPWGHWSDYGACSKTCGGGVKTRTRRRSCKRSTTVLGDICVKNTDTQSLSCEKQRCSGNSSPLDMIEFIDGQWGAWGARIYGACTVTCGSGSRKFVRKRNCDNPKPGRFGNGCMGQSLDIGMSRSCGLNPCPLDGQWGAWGGRTYTSCSVTCGEGTRGYSESRSCSNPAPQFGGKPCQGERVRIGSVFGCGLPACVVHGAWSAWSYTEVGRCSVSCGGGTKRVTQARTCDNPAPQNGGRRCHGNRSRFVMIRGCNPQSCNVTLVNEKVYISDCDDVINQNVNTSGVFTIQPRDLGLPIRAYCELEKDGTAWLVIQRRLNGLVNFKRRWSEYRDGFGDVSAEYWLGNNDINRITKQGLYQLKIDLTTNTAKKKHVVYDRFYVSSERLGYKLKVGGFHGDIENMLARSNGATFKTKVNSRISKCRNSAVGGFWLKGCFSLNKVPIDTVTWPRWCDVRCYVSTTVMKIRPMV